MLGGVSSEGIQKAKILAAAALIGVKVKQLAFELVANNATAACETALVKMKLDPALGACTASLVASGRRRLVSSSYNVDVTVNAKEVNVDKLVENLAAEGVSATTTEADPIDELSMVPGAVSYTHLTLPTTPYV